jgi:hypothetical protein
MPGVAKGVVTMGSVPSLSIGMIRLGLYLKNGGKLEVAQQMATHESARTTGLYDRRNEDVSLDEVERIGI